MKHYKMSKPTKSKAPPNPSTRSRFVLNTRVGVGMRTRSLSDAARDNFEEQSSGDENFQEAQAIASIVEESPTSPWTWTLMGPNRPSPSHQFYNQWNADPGEGSSRQCSTPGSVITPRPPRLSDRYAAAMASSSRGAVRREG